MRIRSNKMPLRVVIAGVSLTGLGLAALLPMMATDATRIGFAPIITNSIDKVDTGEPTRTDIPGEIGEGSAAPRQILPQAPEASVLAAPEQAESTQASDDAEIMPVMTDEIATTAGGMIGAMADTPVMGATTSLAGDAADSGGIVLALDHARVMRVVGDVTTVIIGNPSIADVSMPDPGIMILTGKSYGETNMVMLDRNGDILAEQTLRVTVRGQSLVSVYRGVQRTTLSCSPTCEIRPTPGDTLDTIQAGLGAFQARNQAALEAVRGSE